MENKKNMSIESKLWMGNLEKWMNEKTIMQFFHEYNFYPKFIQMIKDKKNNWICNYCFIHFCNIYEANDALIKLNGKKIPNSNSNFILKWANSNSKSIDIYVGNLSPEIDNLELFNLFKQKYPSVHHASIITNNNISKGYGFINFLEKKESEKCINEMNGFIFYNKALIVKNKMNNNNKINNYKNKNTEKDNIENKSNDSEEEEIEENNSSNLEKDKTFCIGIIKGHNGPVTSLVCTEDENFAPLLFSGSEDTSIIKWKLYFKDNKFEINENCYQKENIILGEPQNIIKKHENSITSLSLNSNNTQLISTSLDKKIIIWNIYNLNPETIIKDSKSEVLAACFSSDDRMILSGEKDKKFKIYNYQGQLKYCDNEINGYVTCILKILKIKKNYIAVGFSDGKVNIYNSEYYLYKKIPLYSKIKYNKDKLESKEWEQYSVVSLIVDDDGDYLFICYRNGIIIIIDLNCDSDNEEEYIKYIIENDDEINSILFDSKFFLNIFIADNKGFKIRNIKPNKIIFKDNSATCLSLCFDKNKNYLFAGFGDGIIKVYEMTEFIENK